VSDLRPFYWEYPEWTDIQGEMYFTADLLAINAFEIILSGDTWKR
jgi:hypothetical protein